MTIKSFLIFPEKKTKVQIQMQYKFPLEKMTEQAVSLIKHIS